VVKIPEKGKRVEAHEFLRSFKVVTQWLDEVKSERTGSEKTQISYLDHLIVFVRYMDMTPAELIAKAWEEQKREMTADKPPTKTWAEKQALACLNELVKRGRKKYGALQVYAAARSFFRYNGIQFKGKTPTASVETIYHLPSNQQLAQAWKIGTPEQRLAVSILRSTGMRPEDALALVWGDLQWQYDASRAYIDKLSQKEDLRFAVYLTAEASELVRLEMQKRYGSVDGIPKDAKLLDYNYNNLFYLTRRFGRNVNLYLSPKYFRKLFRTRCSPIIGKDAVQKMAGWKIAGAGKHYFLPSPEDCLQTYLEIERLLTFEPKAVADKEQIIENLIMSAIAQGLPAEKAKQMRTIFRVKALKTEDVAVELRKAIEQLKQEEEQTKREETAENAGCANGQHCQRIVSEAELGALLAQSWRVAAVLPSGKIVVSND
jgi:integrase